MALRTPPGRIGSSGPKSSSPVETSARVGLRAQLTRAQPTEASTPSSAGPSEVPMPSTTSLGSMSSPARRTSRPDFRRASVTSRPSASLASSFRTIASAPSGSIAPVEIRIASPGPRVRSAGWPARDSPRIPSVTGLPSPAAAVSAARTAKPSIAELSKPGTASGEVTSSASTLPRASATGTPSGESGRTLSNTSSRALSSAINSRGIVSARLENDLASQFRPRETG